MRIMLVSPPVAKHNTYGKFSFASPSLVSLGLCSVASYIKNVDKLDVIHVSDSALHNFNEGEIISKILDFRPDILGMTSVTASYNTAKRIISHVKKMESAIITVMGGPHVSAMPSEVMNDCPWLDFGIIGEGEISFAGIVEWAKKKTAIEDVDGIIYRDSSKIIIKKQKKVIEDMDTLPFPDLSFVNINDLEHTPIRNSNTSIHIVTSRGCPFRCLHCEQSVFGEVYRSHSVGYIIRQLLYLKENYNVRSVSFEDDSFIISKKKMFEFCTQMIKNKVGVAWNCSLRNELLEEDLLNMMKKAGCRYIYLGIESGEPRLLKLLNRPNNLEMIKKQVSIIKKNKINVHGSFLLGMPTETRASINKTINFALSLKLDSVTFNLFTPFPKTYLRGLAFSRGNVSDNWDDYSDHSPSPSFVPDGFSADELLEYQKIAYRRFYTRPGYVIGHLNYLNPAVILKSLKAVRTLYSL